MDAYGGLSVDDLLDLPSDDFFYPSSSTAGAISDYLLKNPSSSADNGYQQMAANSVCSNFNDILCLPADDHAAELEWLSNYMDDSYYDFAANEFAADASSFYSGITAAGFHSRPRSRRPPSASSVENYIPTLGGAKREENLGGNSGGKEFVEVSPRCTHCASEKTPQWRTGPLGPKTLCNACGVRYKSGRLVPEYRPAASPTFVLTQHSNSHRKVLELRRQKELLLKQQHEAAYGHHYRVC